MHVDFEKNGYMVVRDFFDDTTVKLMRQYWSLKWREITFFRENNLHEELAKIDHTQKVGEKYSIQDDDVGYSFRFYGDTLMEAIELEYGKKVCEVLQATLSPTYTYTRIYEKGAPLIPHQDRAACEISATCPVLISDGRPSQICVSDFRWWDITKEYPPPKYTIDEIKQKGNYSELNLYPGDVLFYKGVERYHWRDPIESDVLIQFFMHFVQSNGESKGQVFDQRPFMGFSKKTNEYIKT